MLNMINSRQSREEGLTPYAQSPAPGRRNLPRASKACQMCRIKKARCNQRQPCSNCYRHAFDCVYSTTGNGRTRSGRSQRMETPRRSDEDRESREPTNPLQSDQISDLSKPRSQIETGNNAHTNISEAEIEPVRSSLAGEEDPRRVTNDVVNDELAQEDSDIVGDINKHTSGTEFYGTSSNFVLLNQLFSHARLHASSTNFRAEFGNGTSRHGEPKKNSTESLQQPHNVASEARSSQSVAKPLTHLGESRLSIVNLLYNDEAMLPPSRPKTPQMLDKGKQVPISADPTQESEHHDEFRRQRLPQAKRITTTHSPDPNLHHPRAKSPSNPLRQNKTPARFVDQVKKISESANLRLEKEYIRIFFNNLHHLHPMLLVDEFRSRCQTEVWNRSQSTESQRNRMHFLALYNIVVAVGALIAGPESLQGFERELGVSAGTVNVNPLVLSKSSLILSKTYFQKSKVLLGDIFEVCSLESAQTLFYISLYCQNSLKPHSCYMYSGMAVRTALAIGLPSESMSRSSAARRAARRTWWCIYSHEIDMCCSSGRRDSLMKPGSYLIPLPQIRDQNQETPEIEEHSMSMINEMVHFSVILRRASKEIYHDSKGLTLFEKSAIALELDALLGNWRSSLPLWLNLDVKSLREPEWASKQKLVLHLRYLNARILLHRPFLASSASADFLQLERNIEPCLDAARKTIDLLYESYEKRHYFRTWWYNSTYTLYAGMIILYIILLNYTKISGDELLRDVEKSREILLAMEEASVAQRSAKLMSEVLEVAKTYISQRRASTNAFAEPSLFHQSGAPENQSQADLENYDISALNCFPDSEWSRTLFAHDLPSSSRGDMLATLIDPTILLDFTANSNDYSRARSVASANSVSGGGTVSGFYESPGQGGEALGESQVGDFSNSAQWSVPWGTFSEPLHLQTGIW